jgi:hypothetical protein
MSETEDLTGPLLKMLRQCGVWATRMQSGVVKVKGGWCHMSPKGTADILARPGGRVVWIETKIGKYGQSEDQKTFQCLVEHMGDKYVIARTIDEGIEAIK